MAVLPLQITLLRYLLCSLVVPVVVISSFPAPCGKGHLLLYRIASGACLVSLQNSGAKLQMDVAQFTSKERKQARKSLLKKIDTYNKQARKSTRQQATSFPITSPSKVRREGGRGSSLSPRSDKKASFVATHYKLASVVHT